MKTIKSIVLLMVFCVFNSNGMISLNNMMNKQLCNALFQLYETAGDNFVSLVPSEIGKSIDECLVALKAEEQELQESMHSLSYKNVFFSMRGAKNMGLLVGGIAGIVASDWFMHNKLAGIDSTNSDVDKEIIRNIENSLANRMHEGASFILHDYGKVRLSQWGEWYVRNKANEMGLKKSDGWDGWDVNKLPYKWWNQIVSTMPKDARNEQVIENIRLEQDLRDYGQGYKQGLVNYASDLALYQIGTKVLAIGAAVGGFGLAQDIKVMRNAKQQLSERYKKCAKMIELLEKAQ